MKKIIALILAALMLLSLCACGDKGGDTIGENIGDNSSISSNTEPEKTPEPKPEAEPTPEPEPELTGELLETDFWSLRYDPEIWAFDEEEDAWFSDDYAEATLYIMDPEDPDYYLIAFEIVASIEDHHDFRSDLVWNGFDMYEYAVNDAYDKVNVGGVDFLCSGDEDGETYLMRLESESATLSIDIDGDPTDPAVKDVLSSIKFTLEDAGNVDAPWPWDGEIYTLEDGERMIGTYTLHSEQIMVDQPIVTMETFDHNVAVSGDLVYIIHDDIICEYSFDGSSLSYVRDIDLGDEYDYVDVATDGTFWFSGFMSPLVNWDGNAKLASYDDMEDVAIHPSGSWGISWFYGNEVEKITINGASVSREAMVFEEVDSISQLIIDDKGNIFVAGSDVDYDHYVFVYDYDGNLKCKLTDEDGEGLGSVTFACQTGNGYLVMDGNMRWVLLYDLDGNYIGHCWDDEIFGTGYPWFCDAQMLDDGSILCVMTDERPDESADELIVFRLSGF